MSLLARLRQQLEKLVRTAAPVDPAVFGDPVALKTAWTPAAGGGANFRTHHLVEAGPGRLEFRATVGMTLFGLVFLVVGIGAGVLFLPALRADGFGKDGLVPLFLAAVFSVAGAVIVVASRRAIVFDRTGGWYWKGWRAPIGPDPAQAQRACRLTDVHALQLIRERVSGKNSSYWSYELNLVLRDGRRLNVVDHGNLEKLREDAQRVKQFLGCKLWDACTPPTP